MGRLTKYGKTSHENGVCCTHFMSKECKEVGGECSYGCKWEEEAWSKLAHYEDLEEQGCIMVNFGELADSLEKLNENTPLAKGIIQLFRNVDDGIKK